jgi:hypothetical protein
MSETGAQPYGALLLVGIGLLVLLATAQLSWWLGRVYFPSKKICREVHERLPGWIRRALGLIGAVPEDLSATGFLACLFWLAVVFLNLLLLAQVLELYISGGRRITIGGFGTYDTVSLLLAGLFSFSQSLFGIATAEAKRPGRRLFLFVCLVVAILVEGLLAYQRADILSTGRHALGETMWDHVITKVGPFLAMLLGWFIPIAHTMAGYVAYPHFLEPMIRYAVKLTGGLCLLAWTAFCWLYFGFHPEEPANIPPSVEALRDKARKLLEDNAGLQRAIGSLQEHKAKASGLRAQSATTPFAALTLDIQRLESDAKVKRGEWDKLMGDLRQQFRKARDLDELDDLRPEIGKATELVDAEAKRIIRDAATLDDILRAIDAQPRMVEQINRHLEAVRQGVPGAQAQYRNATGSRQRIEGESTEILDILRGSNGSRKIVSSTDADQIRSLQEAAMNRTDPAARFARVDISACTTLLNGEVAAALIRT